ncbi:hypothetical protein A2797_01745 [candidate division WWE3 bacterium RIFCSPHIGHO2_01_FULL_48_15]|uniref:Tr-type G domain-containing protein n=1 Tax=candidate division WWE3 bacterium RIFCSPHIGHO2_01_FULL_48_15 TaxID=1802619 RepID=A0A1F4VBU3_UNCKA|nr:MAG: hypothetical protein A2797_01745 [candidate division WWE3 bacterium RIFCSPHIGHO2_01_FULL_48_15]
MAKSKKEVAPIKEKSASHRPPVVVVLGHIDHGKTTLLDYLRKTQVAAKEAGGITQKIGAYQVAVPAGRQESGGRKITFIDTPGHEAFSKMRARGAQVADLAVLVVAADDGVKPQTIEAIAHAKAAKIPIIVALNKIDLASPQDAIRVKGQLAKENLIAEEQGGNIPVVAVSAKTGQGIPELLEIIGLVADLAELPGNPTGPLSAVVIESLLSSQQGPLATVVIREGTIKVGDKIFAEEVEGKVKALVNDRGERINEGGPGTPLQILGFSLVPAVGSQVAREPAASVAKEAATKAVSQEANLNLILRADTQGSLEALGAVLSALESGGKGVDLLLSGVGPVVESDIRLASSAAGVILGFNVPVSSSAQKLADDLGVGVRSFSVIYELLETAEKLLAGAKAIEEEEKEPEAEVVATFTLHSGDTVAGVKVLNGKIKYRDRVRIMRGEEEVHLGRVRGLKVGKDEVSQVHGGQEAGVLIKPLFELKKGDRIVVSSN